MDRRERVITRSETWETEKVISVAEIMNFMGCSETIL
jgi:hypothetical protein